MATASAGASSSDAQSGNIGVGFSIPINDAKRVGQEIIVTGKATHGQLGVSVTDNSAGSASGFTTGAEISAVTPGSGASGFTTGAEISAVTPGSAAAEAGLKAGDVITELGGRSVSDAAALTAATREQAAGAKVTVSFVRAGQQQSADVTLG